MKTDIVDPRNATRRRAASATTVAALTVGVGVGVGVGLSASPAGAAPLTPQGPAATGASSNTNIDNNSREAVRNAFTTWYLPTQSAPIGWSGSVARCDPGAPSAVTSNATLSAVNYFRSLAGVRPVTFDPGLSSSAQQAALMMTANNSLSHNPPGWWRCWSGQGAEAAARSNLSLGVTGAAGVTAMINDSGAGNSAVGHRRWILEPTRATMGAGSTSNALALHTMGAVAPRLDSSPIAWPSAGYFPRELEPSRRWSLTIPGADFSAATVSVVGPDGALSVGRHAPVNGYGDPTLVWQVNDLVERSGLPDRTYRVTVNGIRGWWSSSHSYTVTMIDGVVHGQHAPMGDLNEITVNGNEVTVWGWAFDGNLPGGGLGVELAVGPWAGIVPGGIERPELAQFGIPTRSGFRQTVSIPTGTHDVCLRALDHDGAGYSGIRPLLACRQIVVK